jgi:hypothetical protein
VSAGLQTRIAELEREVKLRRDTALEALTTIRRRTGSVVIPILTKYHELLYAVGNKYEGETRHETALRYIRQAEAAPQPAQPKEKS